MITTCQSYLRDSQKSAPSSLSWLLAPRGGRTRFFARKNKDLNTPCRRGSNSFSFHYRDSGGCFWCSCGRGKLLMASVVQQAARINYFHQSCTSWVRCTTVLTGSSLGNWWHVVLQGNILGGEGLHRLNCYFSRYFYLKSVSSNCLTLFFSFYWNYLPAKQCWK